jgi:hypothetical protein
MKENPASRIFQDALWAEAFEMYQRDHPQGKLSVAPPLVQEEYKERARKVLRDYLATHGIV